MEFIPATVEMIKAKEAFDYAEAAGFIAENLLEQMEKKGVYSTGSLYESLEWRLIGDAIHILYNYYGMFPDMGVGVGVPLSVVSKMRQEGSRHIKAWYTPTIHREVSRLSTAVAVHFGLVASNTLASVTETIEVA